MRKCVRERERNKCTQYKRECMCLFVCVYVCEREIEKG